MARHWYGTPLDGVPKAKTKTRPPVSGSGCWPATEPRAAIVLPQRSEAQLWRAHRRFKQTASAEIQHVVVGQHGYVRLDDGQRLDVCRIHSVMDGLARDVVITGCDAGLQVDDPGVAASGPDNSRASPRAISNRLVAKYAVRPDGKINVGPSVAHIELVHVGFPGCVRISSTPRPSITSPLRISVSASRADVDAVSGIPSQPRTLRGTPQRP